MSHSRWSAEEFSAIAASHSGLITTLLNSPIDSSPPANLTRATSSISKNCTSVEFEATILQALFNHLDLVDRARHHHYTAYLKSWKVAKTQIQEEFGVRALSVTLRLMSSDRMVAFDVHAYLSEHVEILSLSRMLDPKAIFFANKVHCFSRQQTVNRT